VEAFNVNAGSAGITGGVGGAGRGTPVFASVEESCDVGFCNGGLRAAPCWSVNPNPYGRENVSSADHAGCRVFTTKHGSNMNYRIF